MQFELDHKWTEKKAFSSPDPVSNADHVSRSLNLKILGLVRLVLSLKIGHTKDE